jgi:hypothetical protein
MAARPESLEFDFDPLASSEFLGSFIRGLDYEQRHQLTARGGGSSGGSGRRRGSGRRQSPQTRIRGVLRSIVQETEKSARAKQRAAEKAAKEAAYERRIRRRGSEIAKVATERAAQLERRYRQDVKAAAASRRALAQFLIAPSRRTPYQRRVVSGVARQIERGERPRIARAIESSDTRIARLSDAQAIAEIKLRLRSMFLNSENYDNAFERLHYMPDVARVLLGMSDSQLWTLVRQREGADFNRELAHMLRVQLPPVLVSVNPLHYHDSSRTDFGI